MADMATDGGTVRGPDGLARCWWCGDDPLYVRYHDTEWGVPVTDDVRLFEKLSLEGFQAGLSWLITDPQGLPLAYGQSRRFATDAQRGALAVRDGGCRWPGCCRGCRRPSSPASSSPP